MTKLRPRRLGRAAPAALLALALAAAAPAARAAPEVVASVAPLHGLVAAVMAGIATPALLVKGGASPHRYALRPSDAQALSEADAVFWVGEALEPFLVKPLAALAGEARIVAAVELPTVDRLPPRRGGDWRGDDAHGDDAAHGRVDPHLWLDPSNARAIARAAAAVLAEIDPAHAADYAANAERLDTRLAALDAELQAALAPVTDAPYVIFHDAYQYFERRYGLNPVGAVTVGAQHAPSARRLRDIRDRIAAAGARCVFREPQFAPDIVATVIEGTGARVGVLDPLGADIAPGPEHYFTLMRRLAAALADCLGGPDGGA